MNELITSVDISSSESKHNEQEQSEKALKSTPGKRSSSNRDSSSCNYYSSTSKKRTGKYEGSTLLSGKATTQPFQDYFRMYLEFEYEGNFSHIFVDPVCGNDIAHDPIKMP